MKSKDELLKELEGLGIDASKPVRKTRSDAGQMRGTYKPRSDKGKKRGSYINTGNKYRNVFERMLRSHSTGDGEDNLVRDNNLIFPPNIDRRYVFIKTKEREYYTSTKKPMLLEQARWRWFMAEYKNNPAVWGTRIAKWYFIKETDIDLWTFTEWAWAYVYGINGAENRLTPTPIILSYDDYLVGKYNGHPKYNERGDITWTKS